MKHTTYTLERSRAVARAHKIISRIYLHKKKMIKIRGETLHTVWVNGVMVCYKCFVVVKVLLGKVLLVNVVEVSETSDPHTGCPLQSERCEPTYRIPSGPRVT